MGLRRAVALELPTYVHYSENFPYFVNEIARRSLLTVSVKRSKWAIATVKMEAAGGSETS
jgi:hypothetical protein